MTLSPASLLRPFLLVAALLLPFACTSNDVDNCNELCQEAKDKNCTILKGECAPACQSAFNLDDASGCGEIRDAWQTCLNDEDEVCETCQTERFAYEDCLVPYCLDNLNDPDCVVMRDSF